MKVTHRTAPLKPMEEGSLLERRLIVHINETTPPRERGASWVPSILALWVFASVVLLLGW